MPINNLRNLFNSLMTTRPTAEATTRSSALLTSITKPLRDDSSASFLSHEQKFQMVKNKLSDADKGEISALLNDAVESKKLDSVTKNFLSALVGLEPLRNVDSVESASGLRMDSPQKVAVKKWKEIVSNPAQLKKYYDAATDAVDNPALKKEAMDLFNALPAVKPGMSADDFVAAGIWTTAPRGIDAMQKSARYLPGRQVLVETTLKADVPKKNGWSDPVYEAERKKVGSYDPNGVRAVTHRATLVGEDPANKNNFLVDVDGADKPLSIAKSTIYKHNQPHKLSDRHINGDKRDLPYNWESWNIDYNSPLAKAKLNEVAMKMDKHIAQLDFTKSTVPASGGGLALRIGGSGSKKMVDIQKACNEVVFKSIDMLYPKGNTTQPGRAPSGNRDAARQAIKGTGMCVQQSSVYGALLMPFKDIIGIDAQYRSGLNYRHIKGQATDNVYSTRGQSGHGWWQNTYRPSMEMTVTDRTWNQIDLALDKAYGFPYGDRYAARNIGGYENKPVESTDVNVSGDISVDTVDRQFSEVGDGRENHISLTQPGSRG